MTGPELVSVKAPSGASRLAPSGLVTALKQNLPDLSDAELQSLTWPRYQEGAYTLSAKETTCLISPYDGKVLRKWKTSESWVEILGQLHMVLLWQAKGMLVNTYGGILSCILLISGLWLWWPKTIGQLRTRLSLKRGVSLKRTMNDLHNLIGVGGLVFLIMASATGSVFGIWEAVKASTYQALRTPLPPEAPLAVPVPARASRLPYLALVAKVESAMPGARLMHLAYPAKPEQPISAYGAVDEGRSVYVSITLDPYTGNVLQREDAREGGSAGDVMRWIHFLHLGQWGGFPIKVLYAALGLLPLGLYITGVTRYFARKAPKRTAKGRLPSNKDG